MTNIKEGLVAFLTADQALAALIPDGVTGIRLYHEAAPQPAIFPYAVFHLISQTDEQNLATSVDLPTARMQIECWGMGSGGGKNASDLARAIRNSQGGVSNGLRLKEFAGNMGGCIVRAAWIENLADASTSPFDASDNMQRRVVMDFLVIYEGD